MGGAGITTAARGNSRAFPADARLVEDAATARRAELVHQNNTGESR